MVMVRAWDPMISLLLRGVTAKHVSQAEPGTAMVRWCERSCRQGGMFGTIPARRFSQGQPPVLPGERQQAATGPTAVQQGTPCAVADSGMHVCYTTMRQALPCQELASGPG